MSEDEWKKIKVGDRKQEKFEEKKRREGEEAAKKEIVDRRKQEIEAERKAFRLSLEKLEKSVDVVDHYKVTRDFEKLINAKSQPYF